MIRRLLGVAAAILLLHVAACGTRPVVDIEAQPVGVKSDGSSFSTEEVRAAILQGCRIRGWVPELDGSDKVLATITVKGRLVVQVEIPFDTSRYSIRYRSSEGMDFSPETRKIERNYNRWVVNLNSSIKKELRVAATESSHSR